jgi:hypothetical protein
MSLTSHRGEGSGGVGGTNHIRTIFSNLNCDVFCLFDSRYLNDYNNDKRLRCKYRFYEYACRRGKYPFINSYRD